MGHLTVEQRYTIQVLKEEGFSQIKIAKRIGRDKSVVSRELKRNCDQRNGKYKAESALKNVLKGTSPRKNIFVLHLIFRKKQKA